MTCITLSNGGKKRFCVVALAALACVLALALGACSGGGNGSGNAQGNANNANATQSAGATGGSAAAGEGATFSTTVTKDSKFETANFDATEDDLKAAGFELGDSVNVEFSNGQVLRDIPYYDGYYVSQDAPLMIAYPGAGCVSVAKYNGNYWSEVGLTNGDAVTVTMNEKGKYLSQQQNLNLSYSMNRQDYESDVQFANFRALSGGSLKANYLYRGASPLDNAKKRASTVDTLLKDTGMLTVIDLADSESDLQKYFARDGFSSDFAKNRYEAGHTILLSMLSNYQAQDYKEKVVQGLTYLGVRGGPAYIHCQEGKDRTGFVCMIIEAVCGASYDEMCADYMETYKNYYGITKDGTPERYRAVKELYFDAFCKYLLQGQYADAGGAVSATVLSEDDLRGASYRESAIAYLKDGGMSQGEIDMLLLQISE